MVELAPFPASTLSQGYSTEREHFWCVTDYRTDSAPPYLVYTVLDVQEQTGVQATVSSVKLNGSECRKKDGSYMPAIHNHPSGMCQPSVADLRTILLRAAPFDGILCSPGSTVWLYANQLALIYDTAPQGVKRQEAKDAGTERVAATLRAGPVPVARQLPGPGSQGCVHRLRLHPRSGALHVSGL